MTTVCASATSPVTAIFWGRQPAVFDPAIVAMCAEAFESVWELAIPHDDYRPA